MSFWNTLGKSIAKNMPQVIAESIANEAVMKDRKKAEENEQTAGNIRSELMKGYAEDVEANRRLTIYIFSMLDPTGEIQKTEKIKKEAHVQDLAISYLKCFKQKLEDQAKPADMAKKLKGFRESVERGEDDSNSTN